MVDQRGGGGDKQEPGVGEEHSSLRDLLVILDFSRGLFVMWGDVLCCCLIHLPFRKKRKKEKKLSMKYRIILR